MSFCYRGAVQSILAGDGLTYGSAKVRGPHARELTIVFSDLGTRQRLDAGALSQLAGNVFRQESVLVGRRRRYAIAPAESEYVNLHPFCLHLWRPKGTTIPTPPRALVGAATMQECRELLRDATREQ